MCSRRCLGSVKSLCTGKYRDIDISQCFAVVILLAEAFTVDLLAAEGFPKLSDLC